MPEKGGSGGGGERARLAEEVLGGETPKTCGACLQRSLADASVHGAGLDATGCVSTCSPPTVRKMDEQREETSRIS